MYVWALCVGGGVEVDGVGSTESDSVLMVEFREREREREMFLFCGGRDCCVVL